MEKTNTTSNVVAFRPKSAAKQQDLALPQNNRITSAIELADLIDSWMRDGRVSRAQAKQFREVMTARVKTLNLVEGGQK